MHKRTPATTRTALVNIFVLSSLGSVALGTTHTLATWWVDARHAVAFQLDGQPPTYFDPISAGYSWLGAARSPCKRLAVVAGPAGPSDPFAAGSSGSLSATFANVRAN